MLIFQHNIILVLKKHQNLNTHKKSKNIKNKMLQNRIKNTQKTRGGTIFLPLKHYLLQYEYFYHSIIAI